MSSDVDAYTAAAMSLPNGASRLIIVEETASAPQEAYRSARSRDADATFYKDATPRVDHYLRCTVGVAGPSPKAVSAWLVMCYEDGSDVCEEDAACLKILGDGQRRVDIPAGGGTAAFEYRFELGSFRRADRKFRVKIVDDAGRYPPILTSAVLVLSKKKLADELPTAAALARKRARAATPDDSSDECAWRPSEKRALLATNALILDRVASLEASLAALVDSLAGRAPVTRVLAVEEEVAVKLRALRSEGENAPPPVTPWADLRLKVPSPVVVPHRRDLESAVQEEAAVALPNAA